MESSRKLRARFLEVAGSYVGYTASAGKDNIFGAKTGYPNQYWGGSFIDVVAREAKIDLPPCIFPATALAVFADGGRLRRTPRPGDIVFFSLPAPGEPHFATAHIGIVSDTSRWKTHGYVQTIEGQTATGLPRGSQDSNGVYKRTRFTTDITLFARPKFRVPAAKPEPATAKKLPLIRPSHFTTGKPNRSVEHLQVALAQRVPLRHAERGRFDSQTKSAYARYQAQIGYVGKDVTGMPDMPSLVRLARETGLFTAKD